MASEYFFNALHRSLKQYLCTKPKDLFYEKITHLHFLYLRFSFVSSCNNTKAADEKKGWKKIAVVAVDSVKKKAINTIDTVDY
jgi:hypothetical protein